VSVPYFLLFLCFRKASHEIFSELDETKAKVPIFPDTRRSQKQRARDGGEPGASHTIGWSDQPLAHATRWWGHLAHLMMPPFRLYILLGEKMMSMHASILIDSVRPPSAEVCRAAASFP
jgi:hypothetical protein